ncbi:carboxymuconolactone decarboxylase family protein [Streptomyces sp. NBC_00572]|uniref:carboxymuconolactone decarboxylase family protein n=1 Tax=Streptomyces sp. NBC_00572 TaxID=2903664 RepID=UPI002257B9EA|nr:carboxymuconolactone decarboxylase family protein [Streptomyces sp. NBC_00572]MCX4981858.1 carboxymuconolactone decarboxylase family protein [Streptomyces sp. NBC_00572]
MQSRMKDPALVPPDALTSSGSFFKSVNQGALSDQLPEIVALRAGQVNGCDCVHTHVRNLRATGESDERVTAVAAWREAPFFTDAERGALELAEEVTRLADRSPDAVSDAVPDAVPDKLWERLSAHFDEQQLSALILSIGVTNMFNCRTTGVREPAGTSWSRRRP